MNAREALAEIAFRESLSTCGDLRTELVDTLARVAVADSSYPKPGPVETVTSTGVPDPSGPVMVALRRAVLLPCLTPEEVNASIQRTAETVSKLTD